MTSRTFRSEFDFSVPSEVFTREHPTDSWRTLITKHAPDWDDVTIAERRLRNLPTVSDIQELIAVDGYQAHNTIADHLDIVELLSHFPDCDARENILYHYNPDPMLRIIPCDPRTA